MGLEVGLHVFTVSVVNQSIRYKEASPPFLVDIRQMGMFRIKYVVHKLETCEKLSESA